MDSTPSDLIQNIIINIDAALKKISFLPEENRSSSYAQEITEAHAYPLLAGGKRIRPLLTLLMAGVVGGEEGMKKAQNCALAIELIHTYSLVHDDLPCMDDDALRRGKPTSHVIYGEAKALLIGDGLLTEAFRLAVTGTKKQAASIVSALSLGAGAQGMIYGQWLDISLMATQGLTWADLEQIHIHKTGKLIGSSLEIGFLCGIESSHLNNLDEKEIDKLQKICAEIGVKIGLVFQIIDDILDVTQPSHALGKTAGKDAAQEKTTAVSLLGLQEAEKRAQSLTAATLQSISALFSEFTNRGCSPQKHYQELFISVVNSLLLRTK